jgi:excisionase family DNA binding protein
VGRSEERVGEAEALPAEEALFWEAIPAEEGDLDNLGEEADPVEAGALLGGEGVGGGDPAEAILVEEGVGGADPVAPGEGDPAATGAILSEKVLPWEAILAEEGAGEGDLLMGGDPVAGETEELPSARDEALDALLTALLELSAATEAEAQVQATVADENWTLAELAVRAWLLEQAHDARPWAWLAVLVADDRERSDAARQALIRRPDPALLPALRAVLEVLEGEEAPDRALLVQLAQGAGAAIGEGAPGLEVGDPAAALPDLGLPVAAEGEGAPGLAPLGDPALPQFGSSWAWPDLGLAAPVEPGDPGLPVLDAQDQAPAELGDPDLSWFPFALPDPAAHDPVSGAIPEEWGDLPGEAADRPPEAEPILGFPAWVPLEPAPLWGDPEVLEREVLAGIAPTEQADPPFQVMSAAGSPRTLGGDPGLDDKPALAVERLDDTLDDAALVRAWQGGATSTELVALLVAAGVERAEARQRVRAILRAGAETPTAPPLPLAHLVVGLPDPALEGGDLLASPPDRPLVDLGLPLADPGLGQGDPALGAGALLPTGGTVWPLAALPDPVWEWGDPVLGLPDPVLATEDRPPIDLDQTQGDPALERGDPLLEGGDPTLERGDPVPTSGAELLTSKGVAEILGCQDGYVRKLISSGRLPAKKDAKGFNRVARADVLAYQQQQRAERG